MGQRPSTPVGSKEVSGTCEALCVVFSKHPIGDMFLQNLTTEDPLPVQDHVVPRASCIWWRREEEVGRSSLWPWSFVFVLVFNYKFSFFNIYMALFPLFISSWVSFSSMFQGIFLFSLVKFGDKAVIISPYYPFSICRVCRDVISPIPDTSTWCFSSFFDLINLTRGKIYRCHWPSQ